MIIDRLDTRVLQLIHELLLLLEDVLQLSQGGLHLLQRELVLTLCGLVLGHPGVELGDGVVEQDPLLHQHLQLLHPAIGDCLDLAVPLLETSDLGISLSVSGHLLSSSLSSRKDLHEVDTVLVEGLDLIVESLHFVEGRRLGETLSSRFLCSSQPGGELLDTSPVLSPVLDALDLGVGLQLHDVVGDPLQLVLEGLSISGDLVTLGQQLKLPVGVSLEDLQLGSNVLLEVHGPGNSVLGKHSTGGFLDVLQLGGGGILPGVESLQRVVEVSKSSNKLLNLGYSCFEATNNLELLLDSLNLLGEDLLLVLGDSDAHCLEVAVNGVEQTGNSIIRFLQDILSLFEVSVSGLQVEDLLNLLDLLFSPIKLASNSLAVLGVSNEGVLSLSEESKSVD